MRSRRAFHLSRWHFRLHLANEWNMIDSYLKQMTSHGTNNKQTYFTINFAFWPGQLKVSLYFMSTLFVLCVLFVINERVQFGIY